MINKISIIGAGGHARSVINLLELNGFCIQGIYDDSYGKGKKEMISGYPLKGSLKSLPAAGSAGLVLAVGDNKKRCRLFGLFAGGIVKKNIIHPLAVVERHVLLGDSNLIFANAYINSGAAIGDNNILNTSSIIEHEARIGSHNHISVGSVICGRTGIGDRCFIGAGSVIIDKIVICSDVTIGAGSVVVRDITAAGTYAGNPAKRIK